MEDCAMPFSYTLHCSYPRSTKSVNYICRRIDCEGSANFGASTSGYTCSYHFNNNKNNNNNTNNRPDAFEIRPWFLEALAFSKK